MDRRLLLLSLMAAAGASPVLAQATAPMTPTAAPTAGGNAMGQAEMDHAMKTAMAGAASLMMADAGLQKATNARVKDFAKFEHDEQTTIAEILKSMDPNMAPPKPDAKSAEMIEKMKGMKAGAEFDRLFVMAQTEGHEKLLAIQEDYLKMGKNREHVSIAKLARGMIKEHLVLLGDLKKLA